MRFKGAPDYKPDWNVQYGVELYDHVKDPEENENEARDPDYKTVVLELSKLLHAGWRHVPSQDLEYESLIKQGRKEGHSFLLFAIFQLGCLILAVCLCFSICLCIRYRRSNEDLGHSAIAELVKRHIPLEAKGAHI